MHKGGKSVNDDQNEEVIVGELKHRQTYTQLQCIAQALLYMQTVFYCLRVERGLRIRSVFGFAVCGPQCKDVPYYAITMLKGSSPARLGGRFNFEACDLEASSPTDTTPMKTLIEFLRHGYIGMAGVGSPLSMAHRCPAYFGLPLRFWHVESRKRRNCCHCVPGHIARGSVVAR